MLDYFEWNVQKYFECNLIFMNWNNTRSFWVCLSRYCIKDFNRLCKSDQIMEKGLKIIDKNNEHKIFGLEISLKQGEEV